MAASKAAITSPSLEIPGFRRSGSLTLVAASSAASSTDSAQNLGTAQHEHEEAINEGNDIADSISVITETHVDPVLRQSSIFIPEQLDTEKQSQMHHHLSRSSSTAPSACSPPPAQSDSNNIVTFNGENDPDNPENYPFRRKSIITFILAGLTFSTTFTSSIFSTSIPATSQLFKLSETTMTLGTSFFLLGFTTGPILWGPISELYGRKLPLLIGVGGMSLFQIGVAVSQNAYTVFICRFFGGVFGVSPLCVVGGALADFWDPVQRGVAVGIYSMCTFIGPVAAPIMGGYVSESRLGWRWTHYFGLMLSLLFWGIALIWLPETSHPRLLQIKAKNLRHETGNWALHAPADEKRITARIVIERYLTRPFRMVRQEPILASLCLYIGLTYGILYLFLTAYPYSFHTQRGWSPGNAGLPFLAITVGVILGGIINSWWSVTQFRKRLAAANDTPPSTPQKDEEKATDNQDSEKQVGGKSNSNNAAIAPEARLPPMLLGALLLPPGLFLFALTSSPRITPWPQILSGIPMGAGILLILVNGLNYIVDVYKINANSAIAANTVIRCSFGAGFPMFAGVMYERLGVRGATCVLAGLSVLFGAGPFVFWRYGEGIRRRSRFVLEE